MTHREPNFSSLAVNSGRRVLDQTLVGMNECSVGIRQIIVMLANAASMKPAIHHERYATPSARSMLPTRDCGLSQQSRNKSNKCYVTATCIR